MSPSSFVLRMLPLAALSLVACARESSNEPAAKPSSKPVPIAKAPAAPKPIDVMAKLGPVKPEADHHQPPPPTTPLKTVGAMGEGLEGDVSYFKLLSVKPCGDAKSREEAEARKDPKARAVYAAEVEIVAKTRMNVSPRDLSLGKGGFSFMASVDPKRELKGCTPLLQISLLQPKQSARGFVLFDLPAWGPGSNVNELNLIYHPARFGGSTQVLVKLADG